MAAPVLKFKRGILTDLPALAAGEPGFTTDKYDLYVGSHDGNQFVGSGRFWSTETASAGSGVNFFEATANGTNKTLIQSPASLATDLTYVLPSAQGASNTVLTNDGSGNLSWGAGSSNSTLTGFTTITGQLDVQATSDFSGMTTFTNATDNTIGDVNTGSVQLDGGMGVAGNVTVGGATSITKDFFVSGISTFVGAVTFQNGTINLGDADTDDINVGGEFISSLVPNADKAVDLGEFDKQWRDVYAGGSLYGTESLFGTEAANTVVTFTVTVASKTANHRYNGSGSSSGYFIDGSESPFITLLPGVTYDFDQSDGSNSGHPLLFYLESDKTTQYTTGVTASGSPGTDGKTRIVVSDETPVVLHYQCSAHGLMGNAVATNSNVVNTNYDAVLRGRLNVTGNLVATGINTFTQLEVGTASDALVGITSIVDEDTMVSNSATALATQQSIKAYVDSQVTAQDLDFAGDSGTGAVDLDSQSLTIAGTTNEIQTVANSQTITLGLPDDVVVGSSVSAFTLKTGTIQNKEGANAITIADTTANVSIASSLIVTGNLSVLGSQTIVNTETLKVEDSLIEVGLVNDNGDLVPPSSDADIDVGILFHYHTGSAAKKAAVFWDDSAGRIVVANDVSESNSVITMTANTDFADLEIKGLFVNDCAGASQVISCTGTTRSLENITVDGGTFT